MSTLDVVVIGAGVAGLAAARSAIEAGLTAAVVEAGNRIGGRAHTETASLGVPFDRGCFLLHSASVNPLARIARDLGFHLVPRHRPRLIRLGGRWATTAEYRAWERYRERTETRLEAIGRTGKDAAISDHVTDASRWRPMLESWIAAYTGADVEQASTVDFYAYRDTRENWAIREGLGALIARYGEGLPVTLGAPATAVDWSGRGVAVATPKGTVRARAAIVTVSNGVLAADTIRFDPPLPDAKRAAIAGVPMGHANKVAFRFDRDVFGVPPHSAAHLLATTRATSLFQLRPFGWEIAIGYVGGRLAAELERAGERALTDYALERLKLMFGNAIEPRVVASTATAWADEPHVLGAYSVALPGEAHRRAALAETLGDKVFFAGEACHGAFFSTAHGAYLSGLAAARDAAETLGERRRPAAALRARRASTASMGTVPHRRRTR